MKLLFSFFVSLFVLSGCSTTYKIPKQSLLDGPYPTNSSLRPSEILVQKEYDGLDKVAFAVTKTESTFKPQEQEAFLENALGELGIGKVLTEDELVAKIIAEGLDTEVSSASDLISLKKLSETFGNFLVIEWTTDFIGYANWKTELTVIDPAVPEKILEIRKSGVVVLSFDIEFTYPVVNRLREVLIGASQEE